MSSQSRTRMALVAVLALAFAALLLLPAMAAAHTAAAADWESYVIKRDGTLWTWGGNAFGGLGRGDQVPRGVPVQMGAGATWKSVDHGNSVGTVALKQDGSLWHWGDLGIPFTTSPTQYTGGSWDGAAWTSFAVGDMHGLLLKDGPGPGYELWTWGYDNWGQLGDGTVGPGTATPARVGSDLWKSVAAGNGHSLGVKQDGTLWTWGLNDNGQLGQGDKTDRATPTKVGTMSNWAAVFAGPEQSYAVTDTGKLFAWGYNDFGQLGVGDKGQHLSPAAVGGTGWADVAPGPLDCVAIKDDGSLWGWGYNVNGQIGLPPDYVDHNSPARVGTATSWKDVACGAYHTIAVTTDDKFAACGGNQYGQLGLGYPQYRSSPEQMGTVAGWAQIDASLTHAAGVRTDGTLWTWGYNGNGQLGYEGGTGAPAQIGFDSDWTSASAGAYTDGGFTAALKTNGTLWTWGDNAAGQLGLGDLVERHVPTQVGTDADWKSVACSDGTGSRGRTDDAHPDYTLDDHVLALKNDGSLWAWGANDFGQLGDGTMSASSTPLRVGSDNDWAAIAVGDDFSAALKTDGSLWTWGHGQFGQLGQGGTPGASTMTLVPTRGTVAETFKAFACGSGRDSSFMLAVKMDGTLWGWGKNSAGELGQGLSGFDTFSSPVVVSSATDWQSVACGGSYGDNFSLAIKDNGQLWAWGGNYRGTLGNGDYVSLYSPQQVADTSTWMSVAAGSNSFGIKADGTLWAWGDNEYGQLGLGDPSAYWSTTVFNLADYVDTTPPTVTGSSTSAAVGRAAGGARGAGGWTRTARTFKVTAKDTGGSGVSRAQISLTGGVSYLTRNSVTVRNGDVTVYVRAIDRKGNHSAAKPLGRFKIDTTRPKPAALGASVKRGSTAKLRYRIADYSPCVVKIAIKTARGATLKSITVKGARPMAWLVASFHCTLAKGTYRWYVSATDSVGYKQVKPAVGKLVVK